MSQPPVGIDLGTSTSEIAYFSDREPRVILDPESYHRSPIVPSIVSIDKKGQLLVGEPALAYIDLPGHGVREVKRLMGTAERVTLGGISYRPQEVSALILKHLKKNAEHTLGMEIKQVVVSVPANFNDSAKQATKDAAELAGLEVVRLINEPTAAALSFGILNIDTEAQVVVFDFGGGTLDITVLEMVAGVLDAKASYGDPFLGGKEFDATIVRILEERFRSEHPAAMLTDLSRLTIRSEAERAKIALSRKNATAVRIPNYAVESGRPIDLECEITRQEYELALTPYLEQARSCVRKALDAKKIRKEAIDQVILVGGTTSIPVVRQLVAEMFGKEPVSKVDPDLAVVQGAAIQAALAAGIIPSEDGIILTDVCPFGLGVAVAGWVGRHFATNLYDPLIAPNTTIPFSVRRSYSLLHDQQKEVTLTIYQDHEGSASTIEEAAATGLSATIREIPLSPSGAPHSIDVEFNYDINGIVKLRAQIPATGQEVEVISFSDTSRRLSPQELGESRDRIEELWKKSPAWRDFEPLLDHGEVLLKRLSGNRAATLREAMEGLRKALGGHRGEQIEGAANALIDIIFDFESE